LLLACNASRLTRDVPGTAKFPTWRRKDIGLPVVRQFLNAQRIGPTGQWGFENDVTPPQDSFREEVPA
jgi:hypothetical protein